jgi:hypothetical protein
MWFFIIFEFQKTLLYVMNYPQIPHSGWAYFSFIIGCGGNQFLWLSWKEGFYCKA